MLLEVADKFRDCAAYADWPREKTEFVIWSVREVEVLPDLRAITAALPRRSIRHLAGLEYFFPEPYMGGMAMICIVPDDAHVDGRNFER
jgi:hypothetical protein